MAALARSSLLAALASSALLTGCGGRLRDLRSAPVEDDLLSTGLPTVAQ